MQALRRSILVKLGVGRSRNFPEEVMCNLRYEVLAEINQVKTGQGEKGWRQDVLIEVHIQSSEVQENKSSWISQCSCKKPWPPEIQRYIWYKDKECWYSLSLEILCFSHTMRSRSVTICPMNCSDPKDNKISLISLQRTNGNTPNQTSSLSWVLFPQQQFPVLQSSDTSWVS